MSNAQCGEVLRVSKVAVVCCSSAVTIGIISSSDYWQATQQAFPTWVTVVGAVLGLLCALASVVLMAIATHMSIRT